MSFFGQDFRNKKNNVEDDFYYSTDGYIIFTENHGSGRGGSCALSNDLLLIHRQ